jgi:hypothetical protein
MVDNVKMPKILFGLGEFKLSTKFSAGNFWLLEDISFWTPSHL